MFVHDPVAYISAFPDWAYFLIVFALSLCCTVLLTPVARTVALRFGIVDRPGERKIHTKVIPYLGGLAIYCGFWIALMISQPQHVRELGAIMLGATLVMLIGLWDDRHGMNPAVKLLGQTLCAGIVVASDIRFETLRWELAGFPVADSLLTVLWVVGITNAINLMDNMDGLSTGTILIASFVLFLLAAYNGQILVAISALSLSGACFGFLLFNRPPASIFMGDAGSLFLGFMVSVLGVKLHPPVPDPNVSFWVPVILLGLPILDTTLVTTQRILNGRRFYLGGRDHCSHRLVVLGLSRRDAVLVLYLIAANYGFWALLVDSLGMQPVLVGVVTLLTLVLYGFFAGIDPYAPAQTAFSSMLPEATPPAGISRQG